MREKSADKEIKAIPFVILYIFQCHAMAVVFNTLDYLLFSLVLCFATKCSMKSGIHGGLIQEKELETKKQM